MSGKGMPENTTAFRADLLILLRRRTRQRTDSSTKMTDLQPASQLPDSALGGAVEIPTIDGKVKVKIESGTQPGKVLRLRGKCLPSVNGYGTGDLLVNVSVYVPEALNKDEKKALEEMESSDNFKPNTSD